MFRFIILFFSVAVVAVASCVLVFFGFLRQEMPVAYHHESFVERLSLDEGLRAELALVEEAYEARRQEMLARFRVATDHLAKLLESEDGLTEPVALAIREVHAVHGDLQALSVERYFEILDRLPEEKRPILRRMAAEALSQPE